MISKFTGVTIQEARDEEEKDKKEENREGVEDRGELGERQGEANRGEKGKDSLITNTTSESVCSPEGEPNTIRSNKTERQQRGKTKKWFRVKRDRPEKSSPMENVSGSKRACREYSEEGYDLMEIETPMVTKKRGIDMVGNQREQEDDNIQKVAGLTTWALGDK
ncbi:GPI inositol-deacylase [Bienertia sinuspersici]